MVFNASNNKILFINENVYKDSLGYSKKELISKDFLSFIHEDDIKIYHEFKAKCQTNGNYSRIIRVKNRLGNYASFSLSFVNYNETDNILIFILKPEEQLKSNLNKRLTNQELRIKNKFRELLESIPLVICETDLQGKIQYANDYAFTEFKFPKKEFKKSTNIFEFVLPEDKKRILKAIERIKKGLPPKPQIYKLRRNDNTFFYSRILSYPKYRDGTINGLRTIILNISDLIKTQQKLSKSQKRYRLISENANELIIILNKNLKREYINESALKRILGYTKQEIKHKNPVSFVYSEDFNQAVEALKQGIKEGEVVKELRLVKKNGEIVWVEVLGKLFEDFNGTEKGLLICREINARKEAQRELKKSEQKYKHLFENSPLMIILLDRKRNILDVNKKLLKKFNIAPHEIINLRLDDLKHIKPLNFQLFITQFDRLLEKGFCEPFQMEIITKNEEMLTISVQISIVDKQKKELIQVIFRDITAIKLNQTRLRALIELNQMIDSSEKEIVRFVIKTALELTRSNFGILGIFDENLALNRFYHYSNSEIKPVLRKFKEVFTDKINFLDIFSINNNKPLIFNAPKDLTDELGIEVHKDYFFRTMIIPIVIKNKIRAIASFSGKKTDFTSMDLYQLILLLEGMWKNLRQKKAKLELKKSEKKYRELIETASIGVMDYNLMKNKIDYMNPKLLNLLGYENHNKYLLKRLANSIPPEDLTNFFNLPEKENIDFRIYNKADKLHWISAEIIEKRDENNNLLGFRFWCKDISEKKIYEMLSNKLNSNFLNFTTDIQRNIKLLLVSCRDLLSSHLGVYVRKRVKKNETTYSIITSKGKSYKISEKDFQKYMFLNKFFKAHHESFQLYKDINQEKSSVSDPLIKEHKFKACYGKLKRTQNELNSALCVFYKNNPVISKEYETILILISDAIEIENRRNDLMKKLEKQNTRLSEINQIKTELLSRASHELKTPLISIKGYTELLLEFYKSQFNHDVISIIEQIANGSSRLENLVDTLLECSLLDKGKLKLNLEKINLSKIIEEVISELDGLRKLRKLKLHREKILQNNFYIICDGKRIKEVMSNLLLNAIKYTPPGGDIFLNLLSKKKRIIFSIEDTGIGFTDDEKRKLFKQFGKIERYGKGWDVNIEGPGLGLYISKKLISMHNGKLWVESEGRNKGSKFLFSLSKKLKH